MPRWFGEDDVRFDHPPPRDQDGASTFEYAVMLVLGAAALLVLAVVLLTR